MLARSLCEQTCVQGSGDWPRALTCALDPRGLEGPYAFAPRLYLTPRSPVMSDVSVTQNHRGVKRGTPDLHFLVCCRSSTRTTSCAQLCHLCGFFQDDQDVPCKKPVIQQRPEQVCVRG